MLLFMEFRKNIKLESEDKKLKRALQSEYCHILKIIDNMKNIINENNKDTLDNIIIKLEDGKYGIKGFQGYIIQGFHLNRYSEVSYILYENNGNKGI